MSDIVQLGARRFDPNSETKDTKPRDALLAALEAIDSGEIEAAHVIVCVGHRDENGYHTDHFYQGGTFNNFGQLGLLHTIAERFLAQAR